MIFSQYFIKFCLALLDTPFFYFLTRKIKRGGAKGSTMKT